MRKRESRTTDNRRAPQVARSEPKASEVHQGGARSEPKASEDHRDCPTAQSARKTRTRPPPSETTEPPLVVEAHHLTEAAWYVRYPMPGSGQRRSLESLHHNCRQLTGGRSVTYGPDLECDRRHRDRDGKEIFSSSGLAGTRPYCPPDPRPRRSARAPRRARASRYRARSVRRPPGRGRPHTRRRAGRSARAAR